MTKPPTLDYAFSQIRLKVPASFSAQAEKAVHEKLQQAGISPLVKIKVVRRKTDKEFGLKGIRVHVTPSGTAIPSALTRIYFPLLSKTLWYAPVILDQGVRAMWLPGDTADKFVARFEVTRAYENAQEAAFKRSPDGIAAAKAEKAREQAEKAERKAIQAIEKAYPFEYVDSERLPGTYTGFVFNKEQTGMDWVAVRIAALTSYYMKEKGQDFDQAIESAFKRHGKTGISMTHLDYNVPIAYWELANYWKHGEKFDKWMAARINQRMENEGTPERFTTFIGYPTRGVQTLVGHSTTQWWTNLPERISSPWPTKKVEPAPK